MKKIIFVNYPKCSTCQKAKKFLEDNNVEFENRNIITDTPTIKELKEWIQNNEYPINKFFNTSGIMYRSMNLKENLKSCTDDEKLKILSSDGMLIKRPILVVDSKVLLGFKEENWKEFLN